MGDSPAGARVRVLGGLTVDGLTEHQLGSRKGRTLLKALVLARGNPVSAERLADILWGDDPPARPVDQVGVLVSRLRGVLGAGRLPRHDAGYSLLVDWLDLDELRARADEASAALAEGRIAAARAAAAGAVALLRGPVLPEEDGGWVQADRAVGATLAANARRVAAQAALRSGDVLAAGAHAEEALAHDPYDEAALRLLMQAHRAAGRPASALAAYATVRTRLAEELGVSPTPDTEVLHDEILMDPDPAGDSPAPGATSGRTAGELPGRSRELATLDEALQTAAGRGAQLVAVVGEAGIGKTTLLETWAATCHGAGTVLAGHCDALGRDLPLQPVLDALAAWVAALDPDGRQALLGPEADLVAPILGVPAVRGVDHVTVIRDPEVGRAQLFSGIVAVLSRLDGPVVLLLDDLHLAGASTLAWLAYVRRRAQHLLVVAGSRTPVDAGGPPDVTIPLGVLDLAAAAVIVGEERAERLHARSGGHPLLLSALVGVDDEAFPATVREAVEYRAAALGDASATVRAAAVLGPHVDLDLLAEVMRAPASTLLDDLEAAVVAGVLAERGAGFAFRHELERVALEATTPEGRRALVHRDAARVLAGRPHPDALAVAVHADAGGDPALAVEWYGHAADIAATRFDLATAVAHLDRAIGLAPDASLYAARGRVRIALNDLDGAAADADAAIELGGGAPALEVAGWAAYYRRRYKEARTFADEGVVRAPTPDVRVSCLSLGGRVRHGAGDLQDAVTRLHSAVGEAASPEVHGVAQVWLGLARFHEGRPEDGLTLIEAALSDPHPLAHPFAGLHGRWGRVMALGQLGRPADALAAGDDLDDAVRRAGDAGDRMAGPAANVRAWLLRWCGRGDEADDHNRKAVASTDPTSSRAEAYFAGLLDLADGRLLAGDADGAAALLAGDLEPIESWNGTMAWHQRHRWRLLQARLALLDGDRAAAVESSRAVQADAAARGARRYEAFATAVAALAGDVDLAQPHRLETTVVTLRACARLDGWPLVAALADAFGVAAWRQEAVAWTAGLVASSPYRDDTARLVSRVLG